MDYECVCEPYEGEPCEFYSARTVVARKEHKCIECQDTIKVGERHEVSAYKADGYFGSDRTCEFCVSERDRLRKAYPDMPPVVGELACWLVAELRGEFDLLRSYTHGDGVLR